LAVSFVTVAEIIAEVPVWSFAGTFTSATVIAGLVTVRVAVADFVGSLTDVAVTNTVPLPGTVEGAVYVVATPLVVCVKLKLPAVAVQVTPALAVSLLKVAVKLTVPPVRTVAALPATLTVMGCGAGVIVTAVLADFVGSLTDVAVRVTVPPAGTVLGAL
jgi:hypothetical protein